MSAEQVAREHQQQRAALAAVARQAAVQQWTAVDANNVARSWLTQVPTMTAIVTAAQTQAAASADAYLAAVAAAQGTTAAQAATVASSFAGLASDGRQLASLLVQPAFTMLAGLSSGAGKERAQAAGRAALEMIVGTQVADAGRAADQVALAAHTDLEGYVRVLSLPSCSRCILLAGRWYAFDAGFARHPLCDCVGVPAQQWRASGLTTNPQAAYDRLTPAERKTAGWSDSDQDAIAEGADLGQVTNARMGMYTAGGKRFTHSGTSRRARYGGFEIDPDSGDLVKRKRGTKAPPRLTVDQIFADADGDRDEAVRQLRRYGYLRPGVTAAPSREQVRLAARAAASRSERLAVERGFQVAESSGVAIRPELAAARTIETIQAVLERRLPSLVQADFAGFSTATAREYSEGLLRCAEMFPEVRLDFVAQMARGGGHYAEAGGHQIFFSPEWSGTGRRLRYLEQLEREANSGWSVRNSGNPMAVAIHEFGHVLDMDTLGEAAGPEIARILERHAAAEGISVDRLIFRDVSEYAKTNANELAAEAFMDFAINRGEASAVSREIFDALLDAYRTQERLARVGATRVSARAAAEDLSKRTVAQLRALAKERGAKVPSRALKADIVKLLSTEAAPDLTRMTVRELRDLAKERGVKVLSRDRKADLVVKLEAGPVVKVKPTPTAKPATTISDLVDFKVTSAATKKQLNALVAEQIDGTYAGFRVTAYDTEIFGDRVLVGGRVNDATGMQVGTFARSYTRDAGGRLVAHHDLLDLHRDSQGQGFAEAFNAHLEAWYRASGVDRIELEANIDVGGYAWARSGYDFADQLQADMMSWRLKQWLESLENGVVRFDPGPDLLGQLAAANSILERFDKVAFGAPGYPSAYELSQLGRWKGAGRGDRWLGKSVMLNSRWEAVKPL